MVVNFRAREISRSTRKLTRTPTLIKKKKEQLVHWAGKLKKRYSAFRFINLEMWNKWNSNMFFFLITCSSMWNSHRAAWIWSFVLGVVDDAHVLFLALQRWTLAQMATCEEWPPISRSSFAAQAAWAGPRLPTKHTFLQLCHSIIRADNLKITAAGSYRALL
jgi:hypothetical protein